MLDMKLLPQRTSLVAFCQGSGLRGGLPRCPARCTFKSHAVLGHAGKASGNRKLEALKAICAKAGVR